MIDYHIHTKRCGHASGEIKDYVLHAIKNSFKEIGFADHLPLLNKKDPTLTMSSDELDDYFKEIEIIKKQFPQLVIKTGIEADYIPGLESETKKLINNFEFDYVIGSVHFINGWGFDDSRYIEGYKERHIDDIYYDYFKLIASAAKSGLFDIIGHFDLIKKYNFKPEKDQTSNIKETLSAIKKADVCIEINTAGLRKPCGEIYPSQTILELCFQKNIPITLGSDAHLPQEVGESFDKALKLAKKVGYKKLAIFSKRKRRFISL